MPPLKPGPRHDPNAAYKITAALFDVDNTLVDDGSEDLPTERFRDAVQAARGKVTVGIASARPISKTGHIMRYIGADGLSILCNGAQIINGKDGSIVAEWVIDPTTCADITAKVRSLGLPFWINDDGVDYFPSTTLKDGYDRQTDIWDKNSSRIEIPDYKPNKPFVIDFPGITESDIKTVEEVVEAYGDDSITTLISHETKQPDGSLLYDLFIVHKRANKKDALIELARLQNLELSDLMAVGDGRNDAVLVGSAGVGVAMGNSAQETLDVATFIAPNQQDDGAAIALEYATEYLT